MSDSNRFAITLFNEKENLKGYALVMEENTKTENPCSSGKKCSFSIDSILAKSRKLEENHEIASVETENTLLQKTNKSSDERLVEENSGTYNINNTVHPFLNASYPFPENYFYHMRRMYGFRQCATGLTPGPMFLQYPHNLRCFGDLKNIEYNMRNQGQFGSCGTKIPRKYIHSDFKNTYTSNSFENKESVTSYEHVDAPDTGSSSDSDGDVDVNVNVDSYSDASHDDGKSDLGDGNDMSWSDMSATIGDKCRPEGHGRDNASMINTMSKTQI